MLHFGHLKSLGCIAAVLAAGATLVGCKTLPTDHGHTWIDCASEGQLCRVTGPSQVRYGARGRYEYRSTNGSIWCGNDSFHDPAPGLVKHCQVQVRTGAGSGAPLGRPTHWTYCARENGVCHPPPGATVRFGANDRFTYIGNVNGPVSCTTRALGDPAHGFTKSCEYSMPRH